MKIKLYNNDETGLRSSRRKIKGMTLIEVILAMVILVIVASLVVQAAVGIISNVRTSKSVVQKVNYQQSFITSNNANLNGGLSFKIQTGSKTSKDINVQVFEAPTDPAALYKNYDKAGNLKYFVNPN